MSLRSVAVPVETRSNRITGTERKMRNICSGDRVVRLILGVLILGLYGALPSPWRYLTLAGLVPLGAALTGFCPLRAWRLRRSSP